LPFYIFQTNSGTIQAVDTSVLNDIGKTTQAGESSVCISIDAYGPLKFDNNYINCDGIAGVFVTEGETLGTTVCGSTNPCALQTIIGNVTATRNTITTDATHYFYDSASWDGGNHYWRQLNENKNGRYSYFDGNVIGPYSSQVGQGQCWLHEAFANFWLQVGSYPPVNDSSDGTFTNNTCLSTASGMSSAYGFLSQAVYPYPIRNTFVKNNLFINNNSYAQIAANQPWASPRLGTVYGSTSGSCGQGTMLSWVPGENYFLDHNTVSGIGGCQAFFGYYNSDLNSGGWTNNILNLVTGGPYNSATLQGGTFFNPSGYLSGSCATASGTSTIFNCINNQAWQGNVMLGTWSNSFPGSQVDMTTANLTALQGYFTGYTANWPGLSPYSSTTTLAQRQAQIGWFSVPNNNFRLGANSPFISGYTKTQPSPTTDGLSVGVNQDVLEAHQGALSNIRVLSSTSTGFTLAWFSAGYPSYDGVAVLDYGTAAFYNGSGSWTRVSGTAGTPDGRMQSVTVSGLTAHSLVYYRINGQVNQPTGTIQLP
jgi:hypothetical protein